MDPTRPEKRPLLHPDEATRAVDNVLDQKPRAWRLRRLLLLLLPPLLLLVAGQYVYCQLHPMPCESPNGDSDINGAEYGRPVAGPVADHRAPASSPSSSQAVVKSRWASVEGYGPAAATSTTSAPPAERTVLKNFEVAQPVLLPAGAADSDGSTSSVDDVPCSVQVMRHDFAFSYGEPFIGDYAPPDCDFNRVVLNFSVVSVGRQYDRLALMYLGDVEIWRTSTAEPTTPPGISWIYLKDATEYLSLWREPQKVIFDLGNLVNDKYTGIFNTTLTAIFFKSDVPTDAAPPSDLVIPISARQAANNSVSQFTVPLQNATNTIGNFPRNVRRAVFSVSANGQANEEFWWSNVLQSDIYAFNATAGQLTGYSPFREVQVLIDGQLAGVEWPFPVIFTGGVVPSLHRPIAGINAFDLREHEMDITPFLPLLCDGGPHTFTIRIAGLDDDVEDSGPSSDPNRVYSAALTETVDESWYVTGKIFVWLDADPMSITTGDRRPTVQAPAPAVSILHRLTQSANGTNETLAYDTTVRRDLLVSARVVSQSSADTVSWSQALTYSNRGVVSAFGYNQINDFLVSGVDQATGAPVGASGSYRAAYRYPLFANQTYSVSPQGNLSIRAYLEQGKQLETSAGGAGVFASGLEAFGALGARYAGSALTTTKSGSAAFFQTGDQRSSSGYGDAQQVLRFAGVSASGFLGDNGPDVELYFRNVSAVNASVVYDVKRLAGATLATDDVGSSSSSSSSGGGGGGQEAAAVYGDPPTDGAGHGAPRVFMGRQGVDV